MRSRSVLPRRRRRGSTAKSATSGIIVWDCTDTRLEVGLYYLAIVFSSATSALYRFAMSAPVPAALGILTETNALPLPATATWAVDNVVSNVPVLGMFTNGSIT